MVPCWQEIDTLSCITRKCLQGLPFLLAAVGDKLHSLDVYDFPGLLDHVNWCFLWTVPNLRRLTLTGLLDTFDQKCFERGMAGLRCAHRITVSTPIPGWQQHSETDVEDLGLVVRREAAISASHQGCNAQGLSHPSSPQPNPNQPEYAGTWITSASQGGAKLPTWASSQPCPASPLSCAP